ncbi:hypothetical protein Tco_0210452 [Tanacetum coccineum]
MTTLAEFMILSGADNRPPMLDKDLYDSWKKNDVTRIKKYEKLSATEKIQADCDLKETNIILQGLPSNVNTKFLNSLLPEWSKFVTDVKLVKDLHTTNFDQLNAYREQHELHANEVHRLRSSKQGDDPIDAINKMMSFMSTVITSRFLTTNNQLRNSSNPRQQATIHDGRVTWQDSAQRQRGKAMLHDPRVVEGPVTQTVITHNAAYQADDLDAYDSDCDEISTAKAVLMANLSSYGSDVLSEIRPMLYDGSVIAKETNVISIADLEEILMLVEESRSKMLLKQSDPMNQFLIENDRLLDQIISQDIVNIVVNSSVDMHTSVNVNSHVAMNDSVNYVEKCNKCLELKAELIKQHNMVEKYEYNRLSKSFSKLKQHCISLGLAMQLNKEIFQKNNTYVNQTKPTFDHLFELNNLKAELQAKDTTIEKLKANIKRLNKTSTTNSVKKDIDEIETINIELKLKGNNIVDNAAQVSNATTIASECISLIQEIVEQAKSLNPLDRASYSACKYIKLIQELLGHVRDTYLDIHKPSEKLVAVTPINKKKTVSSMFDARHELCFLEFVSDMNASSKSKSVKKAKKKKEWKPTRKVFTKIGYNWKPIGRTFTLVGNACPLTRITATNKVPFREPILLEVVAQEYVVTKVYTRRPKVPKTNGSNSKPKISKSLISNKMEPDTSRGSNTLVAPSSSSLVDLRLSKLFCGIWTSDAQST